MRKALRSTDDRVLAGVASGLAEHFGFTAKTLRALFVVSILLNGLGILLYGAFWLALPTAEPSEERVANGALRKSSTLIALTALLLGGVGALGALGLLNLNSVSVGLAISAIGALSLWLRADITGRKTSLRSDLWLGVLGAAVLALGMFIAVGSNTGWLVLIQALVVLVLILGGVSVGIAPLVVRWWRERESARFEIVRKQERDAVAAHLHDSVLQTLALIRRKADDSSEVNRLARVGETSLRDWLYPRPGAGEAGVATAIRRLTQEIEAEYACSVEVVTVGDRIASGPVEELLAAAGEAIVNAARHSQSSTPIHVFAECTADSVEVFVRDRGIGFELDSVPADRHGVRQSILARMHRAGGTAHIVSQPGTGTEVRLALEVKA